MTSLRALAAALAVPFACSSCATLGSAAGAACGEALLRLLCSASNSVCSGDEDLDGEVDAEAAQAEGQARRLAEAPPPEWTPMPGLAACQLKRTEARVQVSCADGTRAEFLAEVEHEARVIVVDEDTTPDDPCIGRARKQGMDADADGALSAMEIRGRVIVCESEREVFSPTLVGDLAIAVPDDVLLVAARRAVTGDVFLTGDALVWLELPQLRSMGGTLRITHAAALERVSLERLAHVGGDVSVTALPALVDLDLPKIGTVGGSLVVTDNPALPQRALERVVVRLSRKGFSGPVVSGGNAP